MDLTAITRLAHYDVTALIGEGGMGQVSMSDRFRLVNALETKVSKRFQT